MTTGHCPACNTAVSNVNARTITANSGLTTIKSIVFQCPKCQAILGCQVDPSVLKAEIVAEVVAAMQKASAV